MTNQKFICFEQIVPDGFQQVRRITDEVNISPFIARIFHSVTQFIHFPTETKTRQSGTIRGCTIRDKGINPSTTVF